jgi:hypothetical protein
LPDSITHVYAHNLDSDSLNEIVLCTTQRVFVCHVGDTEPSWVSPLLDNPDDLQFGDLNHDSVNDIAVHTPHRIFFYQISDTIAFYSVGIPSETYKGYTLGDANWDSLCDFVVVCQQPFDPDMDLDTVWISQLYGPDFISSDTSILRITNYDWYAGQWEHYREKGFVGKMVLANLGNGADSPPRLIINVAREYMCQDTMPGYEYYGVERSGVYYIVDPRGLAMPIEVSVGAADTFGVYNFSGYRRAFSTCNYSLYILNDSTNYHSVYKKLLKFTTDRVDDSSTVFWEASDHDLPFESSSCLGDLNPSRFGPEYCYERYNAIHQNSIVYDIQMWTLDSGDDSIRVVSAYKAPDILSTPVAILKSFGLTPAYLFVSGRTGNIEAVWLDISREISLVSDIDHNGTDEILSIDGNNLSIYDIAQYTGIGIEAGIPSRFQLLGNYPNPFNAQTIIKYNLPKQSDIGLEIYDILGRKIESIEKPNQPAGLGQITWDAPGEPSGVYFYRLSAGNEQKTGRMLLLK